MSCYNCGKDGTGFYSECSCCSHYFCFDCGCTNKSFFISLILYYNKNNMTEKSKKVSHALRNGCCPCFLNTSCIPSNEFWREIDMELNR